VSKKPLNVLGSMNQNIVGPFAKDEILGLRGKESYLKYHPEDFQKKL
jgi:hypothetical protein